MTRQQNWRGYLFLPQGQAVHNIINEFDQRVLNEPLFWLSPKLSNNMKYECEIFYYTFSDIVDKPNQEYYIPIGSLFFEFVASVNRNQIFSWLNKYSLNKHNYPLKYINKFYNTIRECLNSIAIYDLKNIRNLSQNNFYEYEVELANARLCEEKSSMNNICKYSKYSIPYFASGFFGYYSNNIFSLIACEIIELYKNNYFFRRCECDNFYIKMKRQKLSVNHCPACNPPSKNKAKKTNQQRKRDALIQQFRRGVINRFRLDIELKSNSLKPYHPSKDIYK